MIKARGLTILALAMAFLVCLSSCGDSKRKQFEKGLESLAGNINKAFVHQREITVALALRIEKLYADKALFDLDERSLAKVVGGSFSFFNGQYLNHREDEGLSMTLFDATGGFTNVGRSLKEEAVLLGRLGPDMEADFHSRPYFADIAVFALRSKDEFIAMNYPFLDYASLIPNPAQIHAALGKDFGNFPFISPVLKLNNPAGGQVWPKDIYVAMAGEGILFDCWAPVYSSEKPDELLAVADINLNIEKFGRELFRGIEGIFLLATPSGNIAGASEPAISELALLIPSFYYLKQMHLPKGLGDAFKLSSYGEEGIVSLGKRIAAGESEFRVKIKGTNYLAFTRDIPEVGWKLIGLIKI